MCPLCRHVHPSINHIKCVKNMLACHTVFSRLLKTLKNDTCVKAGELILSFSLQRSCMGIRYQEHKSNDLEIMKKSNAKFRKKGSPCPHLFLNSYVIKLWWYLWYCISVFYASTQFRRDANIFCQIAGIYEIASTELLS